MSAQTIQKTEERVSGSSGKLFVRSWRPDGPTHGVVVIVPGFNSHSAYYEWAGSSLAENGFAVLAVDLRGRGHSDGERFFVRSVDEYAADVDAVVELAKDRYPGIPRFLFGHSAGGVVSCIYALEHQHELSGFVCESFAFQVYAPNFALAAMKGISHVIPHVHLLKLPNNDFSRSSEAVEMMNADPFVSKEKQPTATVAAMVRANERLKVNFQRITLPVLILHGTADKVTKPSGSRFFHEKVGSSDKTLRLYEHHYHDLLNDVDKEQVLNDIRQWLDSHVDQSDPSQQMLTSTSQ